MNARMTEPFNVSGEQLDKLFGEPGREADAFAGRARGAAEVGVRSAVAGRLFFVILSLVGAIGTAVVYLLGGLFALGGGISVGEVVAFAGLVTAAYTPLAALTNAPVEVMTALVSFDRVFEILDLRRPIDDAPDAVEKSRAFADLVTVVEPPSSSIVTVP
jgi:ATP-binding cassette, subfamily B, bacterial